MLREMKGQQSPPGLAAFLAGVPFFAALDERARSQLGK